MRERVIYGYGMENGSITINASQKEVIQRIFEDYTSGNSIRQIMLGLNANGIFSPDGKTWTHRAVGNLLKERRYLGGGSYPAIISEEIFAQVQARRRETNEALGRTAKAERGKPVYDGIIFCGDCGRRFYWIHYRGEGLLGMQPALPREAREGRSLRECQTDYRFGDTKSVYPAAKQDL